MIDEARPRVSIIIPNWNGAHHLPVCLDSLHHQSYPNIEVIVVDNASHDNSLDVVKRYDGIRALAQTTNLGFTGACNTGFQAATGDIQILLNNDTETHPEWVSAIVRTFDEHPEAGMVASKMLLFDRRDILHTAGDYVTPDGLAHNRGVWHKDAGQYNRRVYVFSACGGSAAYRRTMLDEVGLLDEDYFFSFEDVDLAWRAQLAGWRCVFAPDAIVYHKLKASGGGKTASYYDGRNRIFTLVKNYPKDMWQDHGKAVLNAQRDLAWTALKAWRGAEARATLRGLTAGLLGLPRMLRKRRKVQAARKAERLYLERLMQPPYEIPIEQKDRRKGLV